MSDLVEVKKELNLRNVAMPEGLDEDGQAAWKVIAGLLKRKRKTYTGGCTTFYSPAKWREREEKYGLDSKLIVCYDGGEVRYFFEPQSRQDAKLAEELRERLKEAGFYAESCTCWYSAIYRIRT